MVQPKRGPKAKKPTKAVVPAGPVYEESPMVPHKLYPTQWEDNNLYEGVQGQPQVTIEMKDAVEWEGNDLYDSVGGDRQDPQVQMVDNDIYRQG